MITANSTRREAVVLSAAGSVEAQAYPDRLIKMVVPYPPGGPIDTTARLVVQRLGPILGARWLHAAVRECQRPGGGPGGLSLSRLRHGQALHADREGHRGL